MKQILKFVSLLAIVLSVSLLAGPAGVLAEGTDPAEPAPTEVPEPPPPDDFDPRRGNQGRASPRHVHHTWKCELNVANPHNSGHKPGRINVVGTFKCNTRMLEMTITTQLYKRNCILWIFCGWDAVGNPGTKPGFNVSKVSSESNTPCVEGKYRGKSRITYLWPDGVPGGGWNQSIVRDLTC